MKVIYEELPSILVNDSMYEIETGESQLVWRQLGLQYEIPSQTEKQLYHFKLRPCQLFYVCLVFFVPGSQIITLACTVCNCGNSFHNGEIISEQFGNSLQLNLTYSHISVGFVTTDCVFTNKIVLNIIWTMRQNRTPEMGTISASCHKLFGLWLSLYVPGWQCLQIVINPLCSFMPVVWVNIAQNVRNWRSSKQV